MGRKILIQAFVFSTFIYGCADHTETTVVYTPCELSSEISTTHHVSQMHDGDYHERGPFVPWSSNPSEECPSNPTIRSGEFSGKELYITYPAVDEPLETGVVTVPQGKLPVVVFTHANNFYCTAFELYKNLHNHWASWGFVVVSVDSTDANCRRTSKENLQLRSDAQIAALEEVLSWDETVFQGLTIDEDYVFFSGHSRGGGASFLSAEAYPLTRGVITLQGNDLRSIGFSSETLRDYPVLGISASDDKDLKYPHPDLMEDQLGGEYTWVTLFDAIHAYTGDSLRIRKTDDPKVEREEQQAATFYFTTAFLDRHTKLAWDWSKVSTAAVLMSHHGAEKLTTEIYAHGAALRWRRDVEHVWIDTFEERGATLNLLGGDVESDGLDAEVVKTYRPDENPTSGRFSRASALRLRTESEGRYTTHMPEPLLIDSDWTLNARVKLGNESGLERLGLTIVTTEGEIQLDALEFIGPMPLTKWYTQLQVPLEEFVTDETEIVALRFDVEAGEVFVDDLRFTPPLDLQ